MTNTVVSRVRSGERDAIAAPDRAARDHIAIDPHIRVIVLRSGTQNASVPRQVTLRQRGHHATRTATRDPQADLVADRDSPVDPAILYKTVRILPRRDDDVRPKPSDLEAPLRVQARAGGRSSRSSADAPRQGRKTSPPATPTRSRVPELKTLHVGPVLLRLRSRRLLGARRLGERHLTPSAPESTGA